MSGVFAITYFLTISLALCGHRLAVGQHDDHPSLCVFIHAGYFTRRQMPLNAVGENTPPLQTQFGGVVFGLLHGPYLTRWFIEICHCYRFLCENTIYPYTYQKKSVYAMKRMLPIAVTFLFCVSCTEDNTPFPACYDCVATVISSGHTTKEKVCGKKQADAWAKVRTNRVQTAACSRR